MKTQMSHILTLTCVCLSALVARAVFASTVAFDTAGDSAYNNGWTSGSNGGFGWGGGWSFEFIEPGSSETTSDPALEGILNSPAAPDGRAWAFTQNATALRPFSGPLSVGQSFSIDLDGGSAGVGVLFGGTQSPNYFALTSSARNFQLIESVGFRGTPSTVDTRVSVINGPVEVTLFQPQIATYIVQVQSLSSPSTVGTIDVGDFPLIPDEVELGGSSPLTYVNNMNITPEPTTLGMSGLAAIGLLRRRRRFESA